MLNKEKLIKPMRKVSEITFLNFFIKTAKPCQLQLKIDTEFRRTAIEN